ncbi:Ion transport protein-domain-containing protein [Blakeslea trispora]|nr:Ion transport protein-domain-containing protein [Blakeslea trispora]
MTNSNSLSGGKNNDENPPPSARQSQISITSIPQIVLTEPSQSVPQLPNPHDDITIAPSLSPHSHYSNSQTTQNNGTPNLMSPNTPLPLTKDLLQRKNKLDRLLLQKEKSRRRHEQKLSMPDTYMSNDIVDERVTAGLGISTPGISHEHSSSSLSNGRSQNPEKSAATLFSPNMSEWGYELDSFRPTFSESSRGDGKRSKKQHTGTSVSGSSVRNSVSMRAYSANHRYMDTNPNHSQHPHHSYRHSMTYHRQPQTPLQQADVKHKYFLIDFLYQAAQRVINARAPESSQIAQYDTYDLNQAKSTMPPPPKEPEQPEQPEQARLPATIAEDVTSIGINEKVLNPFPTTEMSANSAYSVKQASSQKHRHSWLSFATSWDERSDIDHNSIVEQKPVQEQSDISEATKRPVPHSDVQPNPLQGHTLCLFGPNNPIRLYTWYFIRKRYVEASLFLLMVFHWFLLASVPITANDQKSMFGGQWTHYPILLIQIIYSLEALCKIVAYGLIIAPKQHSLKINTLDANSLWKRKNSLAATIRGSAIVTELSKEQPFSATVDDETKTLFISNHSAYLHSFGNWIDLVSIGSYWIDFVLMIYGYPYISLFKSLASMRPLRLLSILPGTAVILKSLETNWKILLAVSGLIIFFLLLFALIGLISFSGVFSRRCYFTDGSNELQLVQPPVYCSGYFDGSVIVGAYNPETGKTSYPGYHGTICSVGQICMEHSDNNPNSGFVNYDTIFSSFLSVYTFVSMEQWTDLMYISQDADSTVSALYYCLGVYIIGFVLTFLLFAVITSAFARIRADYAVSAFTAKKNGYPVLRDAEGLDDEMMWTFDNAPEDLGKGVTRLKIRWWIVRLVKKRAFFYFCGFLVFLDLIFMCLKSFTASQSTLNLVDSAETAFTLIFAIEILLRMIGAVSWMGFWSSKTNLFDLFLVISTCVIQLPMIQDSSAYKYLTIFQILRSYRLFICIPRVQRLVLRALGTGESVFNVMVFLVLATALCSTIFMQMFGGDFTEVVSNTDTENRFDTFWQSFVSLIVIYTSETWTDILYNAMQSQAGYGTVYAAIALSIYFAFGRYIMSALYIAVVLENFELSDDYIRHYQIKDFIQRHRFKDSDRTETILLKLFRPLYRSNDSKQIQVTDLPANLTAPLTKADIDSILSDKTKKNHLQHQSVRHLSWIEQKLACVLRTIRQRIPFLQKQNSVKSVPINFLTQDADEAPLDYDVIAAEENRAAQKEDMPVVNSLFFFSENSRIRNWCRKLVGYSSSDSQAEKQNLFNWIVMACVLVSILMVILDEPSTRLLRKDTSKADVYSTIEIALSIVFLVEVSIRIIADGFLLTPNAYLRNHWNQLDLSVILLNIGTIFISYENTPRGLSTFRSLRILRLIRYFDGVRDIFVSLFYALPLMFDALIFTMLVLIPFSIYGLNIFNGLMWICNDDSVATRGECIGEYQINISQDDGIEMNILTPRIWQNPQDGFINYDDFPNALQHLFSLTSTEGWVDSMFSAMSVPEAVNLQPSFDWELNKVYHGLFYLVFMIISQGTMQLFVGVIIEKFKERSGITTLTTAQRQYLDLQRLLASVKPTIKAFRPTSRIRRICYDIVKEKHGKFNRLMMIIVTINILTIASEFQNEPDWLSSTQDYAYLGFTIIYVVECAIKLIGLGWKKWIQSKWNWFDFIIATAALILLIFRFAMPDLWTLRAERYCLILAAFRLGEGIESLQTLYHTIGKSMPSIIQVSAVFMVAMCLFAMLFMEFFGLTKYGVYGTSHVNFRDYGNALLLLVRATSGEAWNAIIVDYAVQYPNCNKADNYLDDDCGSPFWAYFLFNAFYIICTHIFMNLFTAVIISKFEYTYETRTRFTQITKADLRMFKHAWADIDTRASGYIQKEDVAKLLGKLTGQFHCRIYDESMSIENISKIIKQGKANESNLPVLSSAHASPKSPGGENIEHEYNLSELNRHLDKMDHEEVRKRRIEYNILYKEIIQSETPKGIPFEDVLTILSYRFIDITASLTLDPLIARLEKIEQLRQEYYLEKAAGFFFSQIQKRRFVKELWKKRDEDEVNKLGVTSPNHFEFPSSNLSVPESPMGYFNVSKNSKRKSPPVPRIVIDNAPLNTDNFSPVSAGTNSIPVSPMSTYSVENTPLDSSYGGPAYSLAVTAGTNSIPSSPNTDFEATGGSNRSPFTNVLSPYSPMAPQLSPASRQHWLLIDGNVDMSTETSDGLMDSIQNSIWSDMLRDERT